MTVAQLTLDLPHRAALGAEDFLVSDCNLAAVRLIDAWPEWQDHVQLLIGPAASGKTHLARVWQALSGAQALSPETVAHTVHRCDGRGDAARGRGCRPRAYDEKALFHLLNLAREKGLFVLLTARERAEPVGYCAARPLVAAERGPGCRDRGARRGAAPHSDAQAFHRPAARYRSQSARPTWRCMSTARWPPLPLPSRRSTGRRSPRAARSAASSSSRRLRRPRA